jgi:hypothetical protein
MPASGAYVVRYGWNRRSAGLIAGSAVFVLAAVFVSMPLAWRVVTIVFFGGCLLVFAASILSRRVALQVDAAGIILGGTPGRYRATTLHVPWPDVAEVRLWRQPLPYGRSMRYIGVTRRDGAPPLAGSRAGRASAAVAGTLVPRGLSADLLAASRPISLWRLDERQLAAAVATFAPGVRVIDRG